MTGILDNDFLALKIALHREQLVSGIKCDGSLSDNGQPLRQPARASRLMARV